MLSRERRPVPAFAIPAPLPSLRDALQRRAAIFGPFDADPAPMAPRGAWRAFSDVARRAVAALSS